MTNELTKGRPLKLILLFSIPLLVGNLFQQFYNMADTIIVGRTIGVQALAGVGATGCITFMVLGFINGFASGLAVITAQRFGAGDEVGVRRSIAVSIMLSVAATIVVTALSVCFARPLLELMDTPSDIIEDAYRYLIIVFWGIVATIFFNLFSSILRALGDSKTPLIFLVIACLINIGLDFLLILVFHMGVAGAATATVISQLFSAVACLIYSLFRYPIMRLHKEDWRFESFFVGEHLRTALPMGFQFSIISIGSLILQTAMNRLGSAAVGACTAATRIQQFVSQPMVSFGVAMANYSAQNYGANRLDRIRQGVRSGVIISVTFSVCAMIAMMLFGGFFAQLFVGDEPEVVSLAQKYLTCNSTFYVELGLIFICRNTLQGMNHGIVPLVSGATELLMRSIGAFLFASAFGVVGVALSEGIAWLGADVILIPAYFIIMHRTVRKMRTAQPSAQV